jgi:pheromone shutdown protein TraB
MADCKIVVVGCNHGIQPRDPDPLLGDCDQVKEHKAQFQKLIDALVKQNKIQFIGEEWGMPSITIAHVTADAATIPWVNFNTTHEDLDALKIPREYLIETHSPEQKEKWTRQREPVMLKKILERKGNATQLLVICGFGHMKPLGEMLRKTCGATETVDCRMLDWYDDQLFAD